MEFGCMIFDIFFLVTTYYESNADGIHHAAMVVVNSHMYPIVLDTPIHVTCPLNYCGSHLLRCSMLHIETS